SIGQRDALVRPAHRLHAFICRLRRFSTDSGGTHRTIRRVAHPPVEPHVQKQRSRLTVGQAASKFIGLVVFTLSRRPPLQGVCGFVIARREPRRRACPCSLVERRIHVQGSY